MERYTANRIPNETYSIVELYDSSCRGKATIVPAIGNNLISYESNGRQIIFPPRDIQALLEEPFSSTMYGSPILFPPNRVKNGAFRYLGQDYQLPINEPPDHHLHGEISKKAWKVVEFGASEERGAFLTCRFDLTAHPEIMAYFPHELEFEVTHRLLEGRFIMEIKVENKGTCAAPFALGLHPYFAIHGEKNCTLTVPAEQEWPVTEQAFITGLPTRSDFCQRLKEGISITDFPELGCSLLTLGGDRICKMDMKEKGYRIAYQIDQGFPFVVLFKPNWIDAFSLEPYSYVTDAFNLPYPEPITGARCIKPSEILQFSTSMWMEMTK